MSYNRVQKFEEITTSMLDLYKRKNADYGNSVAKTFDEWGLVSFLVRMEDKMNRVINLTQKQGEAKVADEKIEDTILDLEMPFIRSKTLFIIVSTRLSSFSAE